MADIDLGPISGGKSGSTSSPYVAPGSLSAIRQAIIAAHLRRVREMQDVHGDAIIDGPALHPESDGSVTRYADLGQAGLRQGAIDMLSQAADVAPGSSGVAYNILRPISEALYGTHVRSPGEHLQNTSDYIGITDPTVQPNTTGERYMSEGARFIGGSIIPEASLARIGASAASRVADGAAISSLSRIERMGLDYIHSPARVAAGNVAGAVGTTAGGDTAAQLDERLRPLGQIVGGLVGGAVPFAGMRAHPVEDEHLGPVEEPVGSVATVEPETPNVPGEIVPTPSVRISGEVPPVAEAALPRTDTPIPANDAARVDPIDTARDQAIREHAAAHDLTPAETAEMYWTNENPELTASIRDRTNELHQEAVVQTHGADEDFGPAGTAGTEPVVIRPEENAPVTEGGVDRVASPALDPHSQHEIANTTETPPVEIGGAGNEPPLPPEELPHENGDGGDEPPHPSDSVVKRLTAALNSARRLLPEQREVYRAARAEKLAKVRGLRDTTSGEEGFHSELGALKGELPKVDFEGVRDQFSQEEVDGLFDRIKNHPDLGGYEPINARAGLAKLLNGGLPTASELALLGRVFPKNFIQAVLRNRSLMQKITGGVTNALNIPRALMSSFDLSAPFRQGAFLVGRKEFWTAWPEMFRQFAKGFRDEPEASAGGNSGAFSSFMRDIRERPTYDLMDRAGLALGEVGHSLTNREEAFMSPWAEKIPVIGRVVRASERAYTAFLNKLRADVFDSFVKQHREAGINLDRDTATLKSMARFINSATGRGDLGALNSSAPLLNATFFSPRLIKSRVDLLNPAFYATLSPIVRHEAVKSLLAFGAIATTIMGLAVAGGMRVESDPRSSDFGKIRNGNVRYDILAGFGQYITLGARLATNQTKTLDGQVQDLGGRYGARTRLDTAGNFILNKFAPVPSLVADYLRGKDPTGQPFNLGQAAISRLTPLYVQDIVSVMQDKGPVGAAESLPGMFGTGIQVIPPGHAIDHLGRHTADLPETETDPVALEINRLNTNPNSQLIGTPRRTNVLTGDTRRDLTDDEFTRYQETAGRYIHDDLRNEMHSPEWARMSDTEKRDTIREIVRDQRANARDELGPVDQPLPEVSVSHTGDSASNEDIPLGPVSGLAGREFSAAAVVSSLFPGIHVTQEHRDPNSRLGRANPDSWHNRGRQAVDVRPIRNMSFADYVDTIREAGYRIIEQKDEVHNPSGWATGPHWHVVIGERAAA